MYRNNTKITPGTYIRSHTVLYYALLAGPVSLCLVFFLILKMETGGEGFAGVDFAPILNYVVPIIAIFGVMASFFVFTHKMKSVEKGWDLTKKLEFYLSTSILRYALLEGPAFLALVSYFLTGREMFLMVMAAILGVFVFLRPTLYRIISDLDLKESEARQLGK